MNTTQVTSRREFLKTSSTAVAGATFAAALTAPRPGYCAEANTIKIALVGCGGRGSGAALNALSTRGPTTLWAMADVFPQRLENSLNSLSARFQAQVCVPKDRQFLGFDAFKRAIESVGPGGVVILATPPAFRPAHFEYAVEKGVHVFMEKSFAVDAPGIRRVLRAGESATKNNLKVATGLMSRHHKPLEEAIQRIHDGAIGQVITCWAYRMHGPLGLSPRKPGASELSHQIANYSNFTWLNGSFIVDWLIHNIDVCCWAKNDWPESAQGMGGRQTRMEPDQLFDHYAAEFAFPDGTRMQAQGRHMGGCHDFFGDVVHGTQGSAVLGEGIPKPRLYKGHKTSSVNVVWDYKGPPCDHYQNEHDLLFDAIRNDLSYNEVERSANSCLTAIMGRMAVESGKLITWKEALNSNVQLAPGLENTVSLEAPPPIRPDSSGKYSIAMPGQTQAL